MQRPKVFLFLFADFEEISISSLEKHLVVGGTNTMNNGTLLVEANVETASATGNAPR